jgi:hypothetical protein
MGSFLRKCDRVGFCVLTCMLGAVGLFLFVDALFMTSCRSTERQLKSSGTFDGGQLITTQKSFEHLCSEKSLPSRLDPAIAGQNYVLLTYAASTSSAATLAMTSSALVAYTLTAVKTQTP